MVLGLCQWMKRSSMVSRSGWRQMEHLRRWRARSGRLWMKLGMAPRLDWALVVWPLAVWSWVLRLRSPRLLAGQEGSSVVTFKEPLEGLSTGVWALMISFCTSGECADMDGVSFEF